MRRAVLFACWLSASAVVAAEPGKKPNIRLIFADDQSYKTVGGYARGWHRRVVPQGQLPVLVCWLNGEPPGYPAVKKC